MPEELICKRVEFYLEDWAAINMLAKGRMATFQELADGAFRDLLKRHNRPVGLKASLRQSLSGEENAAPLNKRSNGKPNRGRLGRGRGFYTPDRAHSAVDTDEPRDRLCEARTR